MMRSRLLAISVAVLVGVGACSGGEEVATTEGNAVASGDLTPCVDDGTDENGDGAMDIQDAYFGFGESRRWYEVSGVLVREAVPKEESPEIQSLVALYVSSPAVVIEAQEAAVVGDPAAVAPREFVTSESMGLPLAAAADAGYRTLLSDRGSGVWGVAVSSAGEVVFLGNCYDRVYGGVFAEMLASEVAVAAGVGSEEELLMALISGELDAQAIVEEIAARDDPPSWANLSERQRQIHEGDTPESVIDSLEPLTIRVEVPEDWLAQGPVLCPWLELGWMDCLALSPANVVEGGVLELDVYRKPGAGIELWLFEEAPQELPGAGVHVGTLERASVESGVVTVATDEDLAGVLSAADAQDAFVVVP